MRKIKGKYLIKEYEQKYGSLKKAKEQFEKKPWHATRTRPRRMGILPRSPRGRTRARTFNICSSRIFRTDLEILDMIKNEKPQSLAELSELVNKDISTVQRKVNKLNKEGLVELTGCNINNAKIPSFKYDTIEIAIWKKTYFILHFIEERISYNLDTKVGKATSVSTLKKVMGMWSYLMLHNTFNFV